MTSPHWPLTGLRLRTPRLELRWPSLQDLDELVALAAAGVHDPQVQPPARSLRFFWSQWASWEPDNWELSFAVVHQGDIVGVQALKAADFAILREVHTGSWIGRRYQGRGIGTEMRAAVLSLAFDDLRAEYARSTAHSDNAASLGVSRKLGYVDDGIEHFVVRGEAINAQRLLLDRATWQARRPLRVRASGRGPCLPWFGLNPAPAAAAAAPTGR